MNEELKAAYYAFLANPANRNSWAVFQSPQLLRSLGYI
jgi:hypothetical protein